MGMLEGPAGRRFLLGAYCVWSGITCTAAGAWASSGCSGAAKAIVWIGVTAAVAVAAGWLADSAMALLRRLLSGNRGRFRA